MNYKFITSNGEHFVDKFGKYFWLTLILTFLVLWLFTGDWLQAFYYSVSLPVGSMDIVFGVAVILLTFLQLAIYIHKKISK